MEFQTSAAESYVIQSPFDDIESGHLLGYEQHALACRDGPRNQVDDGLRFPRSRRALDHHVVPVEGIERRERLRAIRIDHLRKFTMRELVIEQRWSLAGG